jgi:hypothetical protein
MSRRKDPVDVIGAIFAAIVIVGVIGGGFWLRASAPCSWYALNPVKDVPARCLMHR